MRWFLAASVAVAALASPLATAQAAGPVNVAFGTTWDAPSTKLQNIVDSYIGTPGAINVSSDFVGAHTGDIDPWFWVDNKISALLVSEIAGFANNNQMGWYIEGTPNPTVIDGVDDGLIFDGPAGPGSSELVVFPNGAKKFGFWLNPNGPYSSLNAPEPEKFFTNRTYNDLGASGVGALHAPFDGDVQALVFDVSQWKGPNTWLVCFEDTDSGAPVTACCSGTDNDFNDMVFEVKALGATPTQTLTFGQIKSIYRH